jgi:hypothetical protein
MIVHSADPICTRCEMFLINTHPELANWWRAVRPCYLDLHISESWRNKAEQDADVAGGKSFTHWPTSYHNRVDSNNKPCSHALDVFLLSQKYPKGEWGNDLVDICREIDKKFKPTFPFVTWGGNWNSKLHDMDHFQIETDELPLDPPV